jgi:pimeloyl-ACP methyl ester carboxylesterase
LDDLEIIRAHYFGYSMGARIGFAIARYAPERIHSLILGGGSPYARPPGPDPMIEALRRGAEAIPSIWGVPLSSALRARLTQNDIEAITACRTKAFQGPGFAETLPMMAMPCLVFAGEADPVYRENRECVRSMPNATFFHSQASTIPKPSYAATSCYRTLPGSCGRWAGRARGD